MNSNAYIHPFEQQEERRPDARALARDAVRLIKQDTSRLVDEITRRPRLRSPNQIEAKSTLALSKRLRVFDTGASRNDDTYKHDPEGFFSPLVIQCYNEYIHGKRLLKDGTIRESDNWQRGMPLDTYAKSLWRHFLDFWLWHRGYGHRARASLKVALCAILFNAMGYLHEILKQEERKLNDLAIFRRS